MRSTTLSLLLLAACHSSSVGPSDDSLPDPPPRDSEADADTDADADSDTDSDADPAFDQAAVDALVAELSPDRFRETIATLADFGDRSVGSTSNEAAVDWAAQELASMGYEVERQAFRYGNSEPENLWATRVGSVTPDQMYIVGAHLDGRGGGGAADDDGSGCSLVLELARAFASPDVEPEISVRFVLWNAEEVGLVGSEAYVDERRGLQGVEDPAGSGRYPEPRWLGMIQHDMILFDHGVPAGDDQIPTADIDVEYQASAREADAGRSLGAQVVDAAGRYCASYPAELGDEMSNTDSVPFEDHTASISVRENRRQDEIGNGGNPHWHQPTDLPETYSDADYALGMDTVRMTGGALGELSGLRAVE